MGRNPDKNLNYDQWVRGLEDSQKNTVKIKEFWTIGSPLKAQPNPTLLLPEIHHLIILLPSLKFTFSHWEKECNYWD